MIKSIDFPGKEFATKEALFAALRENVSKIIACKTAEVFFSDKKLQNEVTPGFALKIDSETAKVGPQLKEGYIYPIINTTNYLDSHGDLHLRGIWDKSARDQNGKTYYVADHRIETDKIIAWPGDVNMMVKDIPWSWVGKDYEGNTQGLIFEIKKSAIVNASAKEIIDNNRPIQNSVRMQYVKIELAMNSNDKADVMYKANWDKYIGEVANNDVAEERGYFFPVLEAKISKEGSMVPLGSNDATSIQQRKDEADTITSEHKEEPPHPGTQTKQLFINPNLF